ncbi:carbamoyltransferase HypF [Microbulbifer sp. YPW16]|uniref:carbamoyltransferase HypF n=1 Tax=Microbulbifer sp. YPW16 TaxID=2904242 RepID=UPI001E4552C3|nr:carbamoyltransferase HypF [Microbulbifer sp. YPW16]UHQ55685.1 carbamoyltransferase HypF [Microbulbifer sp. YPW16]
MQNNSVERLRIEIGGVVQGVGFRPFVHRLAHGSGLHGWIANDARGVCLEVQGKSAKIRDFVQGLQQHKPKHSRIDRLVSTPVPLRDDIGFCIRESDSGAAPSATVMPDLAPCDDCLAELFDPANRRYRYPFINCTACGPRFSILERLPYDRGNTAMKSFALCEHCHREYTDPRDRRFHAEPNACAECGPQLELVDQRGRSIALMGQALQLAAAAIDSGQVVALKGVGGFQLLVDASNENAVRRLRQRKQRPHKPFAVLYPDLATVRRDCHVSRQEESLLCSRERPIVLLTAKGQADMHIAASIAPQNPLLGVMLPASPLHSLLMQILQRPVVATSGNLAGEPICTDNAQALERLGGIADQFLLHDRPIVRALDDSVQRIIDGQPVMLRRARGYAPLPLQLPGQASSTDRVAVGADLKNCVAIARGNTVQLSQHIGDLDSPMAMEAFRGAIEDLMRFYQLDRCVLLNDLHPGYASHRWAGSSELENTGIQHHRAHFFSCMAEHAHYGPALGICWDGTGYDGDGAIRGGEFLRWDGSTTVTPFASLREFSLPGGERAVREPRRTGASVLFEALGDGAETQQYLSRQFSSSEIRILKCMLERELNSPRCSSVGRLFDAVASLLGLASEVTFEGQAAMAVEHAALESDDSSSYPFGLQQRGGLWLVDWAPVITALLEAGAAGTEVADRAAAFHNTLARMILAIAQKAGEDNIFLSGGVFQNRRLVETTAKLLRQAGFRVHCHGSVPPNDGGIALGQVYYACCMASPGTHKGEGSTLCV